METKKFEMLMDYLDFNVIDLNLFYNKVLNQKLTNKEAENFLYGLKINHENRFQLFICLYEASLKNQPKIAINVFREAYCASNNIYHQIKTSDYTFNVKNFINTHKLKGFDLKNIMFANELNYYNNLPSELTIYRGMCDQEYYSKDYGISWTIDENEAKNYVYFNKNNVKKGQGGVVEFQIEKKLITTIFSVHGKEEIIYL